MDTDLALLEHVPDRVVRIREYTAGGRAVFFESHLVQDAVLRNLHTIAESTQRLSDRIRATEPAVPWRACWIPAREAAGVDPLTALSSQ